MEREPAGSIEYPSPLTFSEVVETTQDGWRSEKRRGLKSLTQVSQAIDLPPSLTESWLDFVIDSFPSYISDDLKQKLRISHPNPIVALSVFKDKRSNSQYFSYDPGIDIPENDVDSWLNGGTCVEEAVIQDLQNDVFANLAKRNKAFIPTKLVNKMIPAYRGELNDLKRELGGETEYQKMRPDIMNALFSGNTEAFSWHLAKIGFRDVNDFFMLVDKYKLIQSQSSKYAEELSRLVPYLKHLMLGGWANGNNPGIVNVSLLFSSLPALMTGKDVIVKGNVFGSALTVAASSALVSMLPVVVTHEMTHYLAQDVDHWGFLVAKTTRKI